MWCSVFQCYRKILYNQNINNVKFRDIYIQSVRKINPDQRDSLQTIIAHLLLHPTTDTARILARDATYLYIALENQHVNLPRGCIKDKRLIELTEKLIDFSPVYVNTYSWFWMGSEIEKQIIKKYRQ